MDSERWKQVDDVLQSVLDLPPEQREAFLRQACAGDEALEREVRSLLESERQAGRFLEHLAIEVAARAVARKQSEDAQDRVDSLIGRTVSHYRIVARLGGGGMGVVYKAQDTKLPRFVALKFLPEALAHKPEALERLKREAYTASSLNHPNICVVYDIDQFEGQPFIVMEFLEGQTLKDRIAANPMDTGELLELAVQIVSGLDAAHAKGVTHRDIKPANIFVTTHAQVKILDFGLAKLTVGAGLVPALTERPQGVPLQEMPTAPIVDADALTSPGTLIGTVAYMSPEQARGENVDTRTDLFSFGAVLYEMATGRQPFQGSSTAVIFAAILTEAPTPASELNPALPAKLEEVINKALEKHREVRYQDASDLRADLRWLKRDRDSARAAPARRPLAVKYWQLAVAGLLLAGVAVRGYFYYFHRTPVLTAKDTIVLADFTNTTGDPVFDGALRQGLAVQLEQSPFLSLVSEAQIHQTLRMMGQPADARLTPEIAGELCLRTGSAVVLNGSIASLGRQYVLGLKAVNCSTGDTLTEQQATAEGKEQVLKALGEAARKLRDKLGESPSTIQKFDTPIEQATTPSLEALQAYSLGMRALMGKAEFAAAVSFSRRAIGLDPKFAMAYALLGSSYKNLGETSLAAENVRKAYELREPVSQREKFWIESAYYRFGMGDLEKARRAYELWAQTYPRDAGPRALGCWLYAVLGQYDKALEQAREALRLDPAAGAPYGAIVYSYLFLNRLEEAHAVAEEAQAKNLDSLNLHFGLYELAFLRSDAAGMAQQVAWSAGKPGVEDVLLAYEADTAAYSGRLGQARELSHRAVASVERAEEKETAAWYETGAAVREALFGNASEARQRAGAALRLSTGRDVEYEAALALAFGGDAARGQAQIENLTDDLGRRLPEDTLVQFNGLPTLRAQLALSRKDASKAIEALRAAAPYELAPWGRLYPVYVRGQAYLAMHQGSEAAAEFQKILNHRGVVLNEPIGALAHLGLARAYALASDTAKARAKYQDFFTLWKDADPDIPILRRANAEYTKLQ